MPPRRSSRIDLHDVVVRIDRDGVATVINAEGAPALALAAAAIDVGDHAAYYVAGGDDWCHFDAGDTTAAEVMSIAQAGAIGGGVDVRVIGLRRMRRGVAPDVDAAVELARRLGDVADAEASVRLRLFPRPFGGARPCREVVEVTLEPDDAPAQKWNIRGAHGARVA